MPKQGFLSPVFREHLLLFFPCSLVQFPKCQQSLTLAMSHICGKHLPQEQTLLGCRMPLETQTLAGLCMYKQIGRWSLRVK